MTDKVERLLNLLAILLETERPLSAQTIRDRLGGQYPEGTAAFRRAFERDKDDLRAMGVPIRVEPVAAADPPVDGYRVDPDEYYLADPELEADELAALQLAATAVRLEGGRPSPGLHKLGGVVDGAGAVPGLATLPASPHLGVLFEAIAGARRVTFDYRGTERQVDPFRLHHERGRWYLQGHDHTRGEPRSFRLDRIEGAVTAGEAGTATTEPPEPGRSMGPSWALGDEPEITARVRIEASHAALARRRVGPGATVRAEDDGAVVLELPVTRRDALRSFVLEFLDAAEIVDPPELRAEMVAWLEQMAAGR